MADKIKSFITEKCSQSNGQHNSHKEIKIVTRSCEECKRVCDAICSRCSKFFCGIECQRKAWPKHRYVCGKPEHLQKTPIVEVESVLHTSSSANATNTAPAEVKKVYPKIPRSGKLVTITAVTKSNVVFVRSKSYEDNFSFFKTVNEMQANAKNFKPLRKIPKCGQIVVTRFIGQYNRAMILNVDNLNAIKLVYIDYGNLETKLFDDLLDAPIHYSELPRFAIPVILKNVPDFYMTGEIRKFMYSYLKDIEVTLNYNVNDFNEDKGAYQVELIDEATNQNLNKVIAELAKPTEQGVGFGHKCRFVAQHIDRYDVPERLRNVNLISKNRTGMLDNIETMFPCLKEELSFKNYVPRFQTLIHLEEIEYLENFRNYNRERAHFTREGEFLSLEIENLAERRPSLVLGDTVRAISPWSNSNSNDNRSFGGVIHKVLLNRILLKFNADFQTKYNGEDYRLEFYFSRYGIRKQHFAVNKIVRHMDESFLFPKKIQMREHLQLQIELDQDNNLYLNDTVCQWYNGLLNVVQKRAVRNILRGETKNMPYVIFGPPGTGKTVTMVETVLQLVKHIPNARLLVGTPSNSSADLITTRIKESGVLQPSDFVRLVSRNHIGKDLIPDYLLPYCATVEIGTCDNAMITTKSGLKLNAQIQNLRHYRVIISTCSTLGNFIQMGFPPGHFTHVFVDETGQCTEPEVMVAITQVAQTRGQVVLTGDPHQLQAIVFNKYS